MRSNLICKLKTCSAHINFVLYLGTTINREIYQSSTLCSARCFSSKETLKDKVIDKTQIKVSEKHKAYRTGRDAYQKDDGKKEDSNWRATSLQRSISKSVFAAGTAKRTTDILKRKSALMSGMEQIQLDETMRKTSGGKR